MKSIILGLVLTIILLIGCKKTENRQPNISLEPSKLSYAEKISTLKGILEKHPENLEGWINLGNMLMDSGRFSEAVQAYSRALEMDPKNVDVIVDRATCYKESGTPLIAEEEYRKAIKLNPKHPNAHRNLAVLLATDLAKPAEAIKEFELYLSLNPNAPDAGNIMRIISDLKSSTTGKK